MQFIDDFYITLPSNVKAPEFPRNRTSKYVTPLPHTLELEGDWVVGLAELNYCHSWYNINDGGNHIRYKYIITNSLDQTKKISAKKTCSIEPAYYSNEISLINILNSTRPSELRGLFKFSEFHKKFQIVLGPSESIGLTKELATLLGFRRTKFECNSRSEDSSELQCDGAERYEKESTYLLYTADYVSDLDANMHSMFIYTDIIRETLVGNIYAPLLRNVCIVPKRYNYVQQSYDRIHYEKLISNRINNIEIKICDSLGQLMKFNFGDIIIKIHFKRRRSFLP